MTDDDLPEDVAETVRDLPPRPVSRRDLRGDTLGLDGVVAIPDAPEDARRIRFYFPDADVVTRFDGDAGEWSVESVESP